MIIPGGREGEGFLNGFSYRRSPRDNSSKAAPSSPQAEHVLPRYRLARPCRLESTELHLTETCAPSI